MEKVTCLCGNRNYQVIHILTKDSIKYPIVRCTRCDLVFMNPRPDYQALKKFYEKNYYYDESLYDRANIVNACKISQDIKRYLKPGSVIDIGCSKGFLLQLLKQQGFIPYGLEPSKDAIQFALKKFKIKIHQGYFDEFSFRPNSYNNLTAIDIIEHVPNPYKTLKKMYKILKTGGVLVVDTPNIASLFYTISRSRWMGFVLPFHLYYFNPKTLSYYINKAGFKQLAVETAHFNILSREGFIRSKGYGSFILKRAILRLFGIKPDIAADVMKQNIAKIETRTSLNNLNENLSFLDQLEIAVNKPINYLLAKRLLLGDSVRIIANK